MRMKQMSMIAKAALATVLALACQTPCNAQLGGLINRAKNAVKETVQDKARESAQQATQQVTDQVQQRAAQEVLGEAPPCPWIMEESATDQQMRALIAQLGKMNPDKTKAFGEQISARAWYNKRLIEGVRNRMFQASSSLELKASKEMEKWGAFYQLLLNNGANFGSCNMKQDDAGVWYVEGQPLFLIRGEGQTYYVTIKDDKPVFCSLAYDATFVDEAGVNAALNAYIANINTAWLLEGYAKENDNILEKEYFRATFTANTIGGAITNNDPSNIERRPRPQAGSMNGSFRAKALAIAKAGNPNVTDVIITSSGWDVKLNALGTPTKRVIYGYVLYKDDNGTKASSRSWKQPYQGNNSYGELMHNGVGVETDFYVK